MRRAIVFAGTTEGYEISRFLQENRIPLISCVATEYGKKSFIEDEYLKIRAERLDQDQMKALFEEEKPELVVDATHPYAAVVTQNIRASAEEKGIPYVRVLRQGEESQKDGVVWVSDIPEAVRCLSGTEGNILLTTGSKELSAFCALPGYKERLYARVLSLPGVMDDCRALGFEGRHLIGMQGPFSQEMNEATLRQYSCRYLVTKDTGAAGGFAEKLDACLAVGATCVVIGRPCEETGLSVPECRKYLADFFGFALPEPRVTFLGIGMDGKKTLTEEGKEILNHAELIIGARRMAESVMRFGQKAVYCYDAEKIAAYIQEHKEYSNIVVPISGDVGFYSLSRRLLKYVPEARLVCGISSVNYFFAKARLPWDDAVIVSSHGRSCNLISLIRENPKVFSILGTGDGVSKIAASLVEFGLGEVWLYVGENLSYENEKVFKARATELVGYRGDPLCVVCAVNEEPRLRYETHGLPDDVFLRGKAPMTKEEVRTVSLSKLRLPKDAICYDVGAGTGSVSVEMALRANWGRVYAIEKKEEALALLRENRSRFALDNLEVVAGTAPDALEELPAPTHVFIGGSSGNMKEILACILEKNGSARIVINCITLETVTEALSLAKELEFPDPDIVQLSAARSRTLAGYHMMMGENPIYIITLQKTESTA